MIDDFDDLESQIAVLTQLAAAREPADIIRTGDRVSWRPRGASPAGRMMGMAVTETVIHHNIRAWHVLDERGMPRTVRCANITKECW